MDVEVIRSTRRKKTVQAEVVDGVLRVRIPGRFTRAEEDRWVAEMQRRLGQRRDTDSNRLTERAVWLADQYGLPRPAAVTWSSRQRRRWGSCTPETRMIRISTMAQPYPEWVLDYLIVHELAHLAEPNHSPRFWGLVDRFPKAERARGYLLDKSDGR